MTLSPADIERALEIAGDAMELRGKELDEYLDRVCGEHSLLHKEVLSFLKYDSPSSILVEEQQHTSPPVLPSLAETDRYELAEEIARGGMGVVHRARDRALGRDVAIKLLHETRKNDPTFLHRFIREAEISAQIQHPGIPPIYEFGQFTDGRAFISMKLIKGQTLAAVLTHRGRTLDDVSRLIGIFEHVCQTIAFAHSRGAIHRDLKPSNIMVGEFGEVQVMDWGLAKMLDDPNDPTPVAESKISPGSRDRGTLVGSIMGTPGYMPLEQVVGRADKTTDVFALGAILFDILTGSLRETVGSPLELKPEMVRADLAEVHHRLDAMDGHSELVDLAKHCLQLNGHDRPNDAAEVAHGVSSYLKTVESQRQAAEIAVAEAQTVAREARKRSIILAISSLLMAIMHAVGGWYFWRYAVQVERNATEVYRSSMVAAYHDYDSGRYVQARGLLDQAPVRLRNWEWHYLKDQLDQSTLSIGRGSGIHSAAFVAGTDLICGVTANNTVELWNRYSGVAEGGHSPGEGSPLAVSPDGRYVLSQTSQGDGLLLWNVANGAVVTEFPVSIGEIDYSAISHDGSYVAIQSVDPDVGVTVYGVSTGKLVGTFDGMHHPMFVKQSGWLIGFQAGALQFWDLEKVEEARPSLDLDDQLVPWRGWSAAVNGTGTRAAAQVANHLVRVWDLQTGESLELQLSRGRYRRAELVFDASGTRLASITIDPAIMDGAIRIWNPDTGEMIRSIEEPLGYQVGVRYHEANWDDGSLLVPMVIDGQREIRLWDLRGNDIRVLKGHESFVYPVAVSPRGDVIASGSWDGTVRIWQMRTGAEIAVLRDHTAMVYGLDFDSDGKRLVTAAGNGEVIVWETSKYTIQKQLDLKAGAYSAVFSPDNSMLVVAHGGLSVYDGNTLEHKVELQADPGYQYPEYVTAVAFSPSGHEFISYRGKQLMANSNLTVWDASTFEVKKKKQSESQYDWVNTVEYSPDGMHVLMGHGSGVISLWQADDLDEPILRVRGHSEDVFDIAYLSDRSRLVTAGRDRTIRMWDTDLHQLAVLRGHTDYVFSLAVSGDGKQVVSGSGDGTVRIWESTPLRERLAAIRAAEVWRSDAAADAQ